MALEDIYTEIVAENSRSKRHKHKLENPTHVLKGVNASCGDEITLEITEKDGIIQEAAFTGDGCAISQASATMMVDDIIGQPVDKALELCNIFIGMIKKEVTDEAELEKLGDAQALEGIANMPARVKCAVLSWHTLENILEE